MIIQSIESTYNPKLEISPKALKIIRNYAIDQQPLECCGFVIIKPRYQVVVQSKNAHEDPMRNFLIPQMDVDYLFTQMKHTDFGRAILFHSHKDSPEFSQKDIHMFERMHHLYEIDWLLYCLRTDSFYRKIERGQVKLNIS